MNALDLVVACDTIIGSLSFKGGPWRYTEAARRAVVNKIQEELRKIEVSQNTPEEGADEPPGRPKPFAGRVRMVPHGATPFTNTDTHGPKCPVCESNVRSLVGQPWIVCNHPWHNEEADDDDAE